MSLGVRAPGLVAALRHVPWSTRSAGVNSHAHNHMLSVDLVLRPLDAACELWDITPGVSTRCLQADAEPPARSRCSRGLMPRTRLKAALSANELL